MSILLDEIKEFWKVNERGNHWFYSSTMEVYIRKTQRNILYSNGPILDIATINVKEGFQGKGVLRDFLDAVEGLGLPIYIENVFADRLQSFFLCRCYEIVSDDGISKCFFKNCALKHHNCH